MSNPWRTFCDAVATHLRATVPACLPSVPEATRIPVVVWREDDLYTLAETNACKAGGMCIIVSHLGGKNPNPKAHDLQVGGQFSISVWKMPQIDMDLKADDLCWDAALAAHDHVPDEGPNNPARRLAILSVAITPDTKFLIWEAIGEVKRLATPAAP